MLKFHLKERLNVVAMAVRMTHSLALTGDGALFYWSSSDPDLQCHQEIVIHNLDYRLTVSAQMFARTSFEVLADLEKLLDLKSLEPWSFRRLPTPAATFPVIINSEDRNGDDEMLRTHDDGTKGLMLCGERDQRFDGFLLSNDGVMEGVDKKIRAVRTKLQQIELLEEKQSKGHPLDCQHISKLQMRLVLENSLAELGA